MANQNYDWAEVKRGDSDYPATHSELVSDIKDEMQRVEGEAAAAGHDHAGDTLGTADNPVAATHTEEIPVNPD